MLSGFKKAEDSEALVVRLYEMEGKPTVAKLRIDRALVAADACAREADVMEVPLGANTAKMVGDVLHVDLAAFGMATVLVG